VGNGVGSPLAPRWIYASEWLACPAVLVVKISFEDDVIYHEHDSPGASKMAAGFSEPHWPRGQSRAAGGGIVLPNERRAAILRAMSSVGRRRLCLELPLVMRWRPKDSS